MLTLAVFVLGGAMFALGMLGIVLLHKIRAVHVATFKLLEDVAQIRRETDNAFAQVEGLLSLHRRLPLVDALPPLRGWAGSPDFLRLLADHVIEARPALIVECSSGASTIVLAAALRRTGAGKVISLEHDQAYAAQTRRLLQEQDLLSWANVVDAPLIPWPEFDGAKWYSLQQMQIPPASIEMLVIDGPPDSTSPRARYPAMRALSPYLTAGCVVYLDDANRESEKRCAASWQAEGYATNLRSLPAEKGCLRFEVQILAGGHAQSHLGQS
jgi:predicted O-methyltransferase YrrM